MTKPRIRCAIYTRKSTDEGLEQEFNSLDAQHEACAAFVASQKHEGWVADKTRYDDGGISGGTLERPALQQLLTDIDGGRVQMVVVYKIDRLTRSLTDFAKLVERFDAANCSFVSVTQAFNTATSMGRLTLNVLLSFAQFEREVTAERIRDKIAASKKKGLWMGGITPLGYDRHPDPLTRKLVVNPREAKTVRELFGFYDELSCLNAVKRKADALRLRSKQHHFKSGRCQGGNPFSRGQIYTLLRNPVYIGKIRHKEKLWDGQHQAIIDKELWDRVQQKLQAASARSRTKYLDEGRTEHTRSAPLTGKLRDETGDRLTPTYTVKSGRRICYYVSNRLITGGKDPTGWRLPSAKLEKALTNKIAQRLEMLASKHQICTSPEIHNGIKIHQNARSLAKRLTSTNSDLVADLISSGRLTSGQIELALNANVLARELELNPNGVDPRALQFSAPFTLRRRGVEGKLVIGDKIPSPDGTLLQALNRAHGWIEEIRAGRPLKEIAAAHNFTVSYVSSRAQLAFLSPSIQRAILAGQQPTELTLEQIIRNPVPLDWEAQAKRYGFADGKHAN